MRKGLERSYVRYALKSNLCYKRRSNDYSELEIREPAVIASRPLEEAPYWTRATAGGPPLEKGTAS